MTDEERHALAKLSRARWILSRLAAKNGSAVEPPSKPDSLTHRHACLVLRRTTRLNLIPLHHADIDTNFDHVDPIHHALTLLEQVAGVTTAENGGGAYTLSPAASAKIVITSDSPYRHLPAFLT